MTNYHLLGSGPSHDILGCQTEKLFIFGIYIGILVFDIWAKAVV